MAKLIVNGAERTLDIEGDTPLLWALRDTLGLTGTKYGCGIGLCGACTVHLNGEVTRSCLTTLDEAEGAQITTIEGLSTGGLNKVQQAWIAESVPQCGYCQSGQIMAAVALLAANPDPSDDDIEEAMTNICRCGTYDRIKKAIRRAAAA